VYENEEFKKKVLEQANFIDVKVNTGVFEPTHSIWLKSWDDYRNLEVPEWLDYIDIFA